MTHDSRAASAANPSGLHRVRRARALGVRVVAVLAVVSWNVACGGPAPPVSPSASAAGASFPVVSPSVPGTTGVPVSPADPGEPLPLEIVESGFTAFGDDGNDVASFAVVLHNPNDGWVASRMEILLDFLDADGAFVAGEEVAVYLVPGQTTALGGEAFGAGRAARLEVRLPEDTSGFRAGTAADEGFDVEDVSTTRREELNVTTGRLVSRFDRPHRLVQLVAVYRDAGGVIVGGAVGGVEAIDSGETVQFEIIDSLPFSNLSTSEVHWQLSGVTR